MSCPPQTVCTGPFVAGEVPDPLSYTFLYADGTPINLTGYQARFAYAEQAARDAPVSRTAALGPADGEVVYTWEAADLAVPGRYVGELWAGDGTLRYASVRVRWNVHRPVGPPPSI
jgi:hypothetical protein